MGAAMNHIPTCRGPRGPRAFRLEGAVITFVLIMISPLAALRLGAAEERKNIDVPAGEAVVTLKELSAQVGGRLLYSHDAVTGVQTRPVRGSYSLAEALDVMLADTGLVASRDGETGAIAVRRLTPAEKNDSRVAATRDGRPNPKAEAGDKVVQMSAVVVTGIRESLADALARQRDSANLKSVLSSNDIGALPDKNVADALSRVAGVSISTVGGEGRFVTIRGIEPGLNNVTMNGEILAASDTGGRSGRAAPLDVLSAASIGRLEVVKTVTPDMDGQSVGGTINILTPTAFDWPDRKFYGTAEYSVNDLLSTGTNYGGDVNYGDRLGSHGQWGLFLSANDSHRDYKTNNIQARNGARGPGGVLTPDRIRLPAWRGERDRTGLTANLEYRGSDNRKYYLRGYYTDNDDKYIEVENRVDIVGPFTNRTPTSGRGVGSWANLTDNNRVIRKVSQYVAGAEIPLGDAFVLEGSVAYTKATEDWPLRDTFDFRSHSNTLPVNFDFSTPYFPMFDFGFGPGQFPTDTRLWEMNRVSTETSYVTEETKSARLDLSWKREIAGRPATIKIGAKGIHRDKSVNDEAQRYTYKARPRINYSDAPSSGNGQTLGVDFARYRDFGEYLDGRYGYGPTTNIDAVTAFFRATRPPWQGFVPNGNALWDHQLSGSYSASTEDDYSLTEKIYAAYAMGDIDLTPALKGIAGVRFERTEASLQSGTLVDGPGGLSLVPISGGTSFTNILPNVQFRFEPRKNLLVRGAVTWTISRPDYVDMSPNSVFEYDDSNSNGIPEGSVDIGNPELKPYESLNFDASVDYYLPNSGVVSVGIFHKELKNAIYEYKDVLTNVQFAGVSLEKLSRTTKRNAAPGKITGLEITYQQNFVFLPPPFDSFGIAANYVITTSSVRSFERSDELTFFGQADDIGNVQLYYQNKGFEARAGYHWQGPSLLTVGASPEFDSYYEKRKNLDLKVAYRFSERWRAYAEVRNATNEPARIYTEKPGLVAFNGEANEYSGITYAMGFGWNY